MKYFIIKIFPYLVFNPCVFVCINAQELRAGDRLPEINLAVSNYETNQINTADLKGKLTIFDFWSHGCTICIQKFASLDSLQEEFGDKIQIFLVNHESKDSTDRFFEKHKKLKRPNLPFISGDTIMHQLFPFKNGYPYQAWVDSEGIVRYVAWYQYATSQNINRVLQGENLDLPVVQERKSLPSLFDSLTLNDLEYFSYISHYTENTYLPGFANADFNQQLTFCGLPIEELFKKAYDEGGTKGFYEPNRTLLLTKDPLMAYHPVDVDLPKEWIKNYCFNYQLLLSKDQANNRYKIMQQDLNRYFKLDPKIEKRMIKCLVLKRLSRKDKLASKGGVFSNNLNKTELYSTDFSAVRGCINVDYSLFQLVFKGYVETNFKMPFIDSTRIPLIKKIDIQFDGKTIDAVELRLLRNQLKKYDLDLVEMNCKRDVLILRDRKI